jgi:hypothetical protein
LPAEWEPGPLALPEKLSGVFQITVHPELLAPKALDAVKTLIVVGKTPRRAFEELAQIREIRVPDVGDEDVEPGYALLWRVGSDEAPVRLKIAPSKTERRRHTRKYAEGELPPERSFFFRGREQKLKLRARNLIQFLQLAEGVDEDTWLFHLRNGDYSEWIRQCIKDSGLAETIRRIEKDRALSAADSLTQVRETIERQYTLPATAADPDKPKASSKEGSSKARRETATR